MCELSLEEGIAFDCQVENCRLAFQADRPPEVGPRPGKASGIGPEGDCGLGDAETLGRQMDGWSNQKMVSEKHRL